MSNPQPHQLLPPFYVALLQAAAQTPIPRNDPLARVKAIEQATKRVKHNHPELFKKEVSNG